MEKRNFLIFKICISIAFAMLIAGAYFYVIFAGDLNPAYLSFGCICACFCFAFIFIGKGFKKFFIILALAVNVASDYFLVFNPSFENAQLIGLCLFCGVQFFYFLYTLTLAKGNGTRVVNLAVRVALCLLAYFILPKYIVLSTLEMIAVMYIINSLVTLLILLLHIKTEWLIFIGFFLFFVCDIFVGLTNGGVELLGITGAFVDFINKFDIAFYTYIPGIFLIALSSVWEKKQQD
ncbi:MAG: hypothetical protein ACI4R8_02000 [Candidatus Caccovivens sp.]